MTPEVARSNRVLVVFNTVCLYGMERSVLETFDILRPQVTPHFLIQRSNQRYGTQLLREVHRRNFSHSFFSDSWDWPRVGKPGSFTQLLKLVWSLVIANWDTLKNSRSNNAIYLPVVSSAYLAFAACLYCRLMNKKVVYFFHDMASQPSHKLRLAVWLATDLVHYAERSRWMVAQSNPFISRRKNHVIPPAVEIRESGALDLSPWLGKRMILFVGQVSAHKGMDLLASAFSSLRDSYDDITLHIVGGGEPESPGWFKELLRQSGSGGSVKYWGYINEVHDLFRAAFLYVHPSPPSRFHESFGRGVVEAMAAGVPAVCFRSGALEEIVVHAETGLVCEEESVPCLAANIGRFLDDAEFRDRCGSRARQRYFRYYSIDSIRTAWLDLLEEERAGEAKTCRSRPEH